MGIAMIGGGYVGLVSGACFEALGADVFIVRADRRRFDALGDGRMPIYEPGLEGLVPRTAGGPLAGSIGNADNIASTG